MLAVFISIKARGLPSVWVSDGFFAQRLVGIAQLAGFPLDFKGSQAASLRYSCNDRFRHLYRLMSKAKHGFAGLGWSDVTDLL